MSAYIVKRRIRSSYGKKGTIKWETVTKASHIGTAFELAEELTKATKSEYKVFHNGKIVHWYF